MSAEDFTQQRSVEETDYLEISEEPQVYLLICLPLIRYTIYSSIATSA